MKRVFSCFLFQKRPGDGRSQGRRALFWLWNALLLAGAAAVLGVVSLALAPGQYGWELFWDYWSFPGLIALNLLPPVVLAALLYGVTGRTWLAYLLTALPVLGLSIGNFYKLSFRNDPVIASDLLILGEAGNMAGKYRLFLFGKLPVALACAGLSVALLALLARGRPGLRPRALTAGLALACALILAPVYGSGDVYESLENEGHVNHWSATQRYISRGFLYPFLHSVKDALPDPPEGYDQQEAAQWLAEYSDQDIPEDKKVNIVGVMLEAFADFSVYDQIGFTQDVYAGYHALEAESYSGNLITNIFAGGTINTERAFLTGVGVGDYDYRGASSSYVWYLRDQGYRTSGDHPSNNWFYNRINVNSYLGFEDYRFSEERYTALSGGDTAPDSIFFPELTASVLEQLEEDRPLFSFSVTYQGHGPYAADECWWEGAEEWFDAPGLDAPSRNILANYLGSLADTQKHLLDMVDAFRASDKPIVLVVFGDHKPWLGNNSSVYAALDIDLTLSSEESFYSYWGTRYLIWANDAAKAVIGHDLAGEGPDISPCFLMNVLFDQLGWKGDAYMQAVDRCWREMPVMHVYGLYRTAAGELIWELDGAQTELVRRMRCLGYYRTHHFSG